MSKFFGPIVQQGFVAPDIHLGIRHWLKRGVGPFFLEKLQNYPAEVDAHSVLVNLSAAFVRNVPIEIFLYDVTMSLGFPFPL